MQADKASLFWADSFSRPSGELALHSHCKVILDQAKRSICHLCGMNCNLQNTSTKIQQRPDAMQRTLDAQVLLILWIICNDVVKIRAVSVLTLGFRHMAFSAR
jgi:hypothetical protein